MFKQDHGLPADPMERYIYFRENPWAFLTHCVFTRDQVDEKEPIKLYPSHRDYLKFFCYLWLKEKKIAVPKSRRMTMSWTNLPLIVWDTIFHKGKDWAVVSKKEDDSMDLVQRADFIFDHIPPEMIPRSLLPTKVGGKMKKSPPVLEFDFGGGDTSKIQGFPMGADQLRQFTFSGIFGDECAFWEQAEEFYTGAKPTTDGGGRMILVSSRSPGFFKKIVFDQINFQGHNFPEIPPVPVKHPMQGVEIWKNPKNGFVVMDIHYTADPEKRGAEFREALRNSLPLHQYMREYEKNWQTFSGMPVYPNFREDLHVARKKLAPHLGLPLLLGWDFGLTPSCVVCQLQGKSLKILKEYVSQNEGIQTFSQKVAADIKLRWPHWQNFDKDVISFIDPAGFQRVQTDLRTCAGELSEHGGFNNVEPGPIDWETRRSSVEHFLLYVERDGAGFELNLEECPTLYEGFKGGYRYPDKVSEVEPDKARPIKNMYSHPHDALQYVANGARLKQNTTSVTIPQPHYNFGN